MNATVRMKPDDNRANGNEAAHGCERSVKSVMTAADSSGRNKISQGKISYFIRQSFIVVKSSTCADWRLR